MSQDIVDTQLRSRLGLGQTLALSSDRDGSGRSESSRSGGDRREESSITRRSTRVWQGKRARPRVSRCVTRGACISSPGARRVVLPTARYPFNCGSGRRDGLLRASSCHSVESAARPIQALKVISEDPATPKRIPDACTAITAAPT